jgi:DNA invertase Pin-like site-specific DNA recombinase
MNEDEPELRMTRTFIHAIAQAEKGRLVARLLAAKRKKADASGYAGGRPPFGYEAREGSLVPKREELEVVR